MIAFIVSVNQRRLWSIELSPTNNRSLSLAWLGGNKEDAEIVLHAGGADEKYHVNWVMPKLKIGDEVTIKIDETDTCDPPTDRKSGEELKQWTRNLRPEGKSANESVRQKKVKKRKDK